MGIKRAVQLTLLVSAVFSAGCSRDGASRATATAAVTGKAAPLARGQIHRAKACDMVTQSEMSAILGGAVAAAAGSRELPPSKTQCIYSSVAGSNANAELEVDWDDGDVKAMGTAAGLVNSVAAGAVDPLQGVGERAYLVTPWLVFVSTHGQLMMIQFDPGTKNVIPMARRIYDTAKLRM
jgi:hypothetical protein